MNRSRSGSSGRGAGTTDRGRAGRKREGFSGFQSGRSDRNYRNSADYRNDLARRTGRGQRQGAIGRGDGYHGQHDGLNHHHHNGRYFNNHHGRNFYFNFGYPFFGGFGYGGFGFGFGWGGYNSFYARVVLGYPYAYWPYFYNSFYYPWWGYGSYPYYAAYDFFPIYRTVYVYGGGGGAYGTDGCWEGRGHDDPYAEPEAPPGEETFEEAPAPTGGAEAEKSSDTAPIERDPAAADSGTAALASSLVEGVDTFTSHDAAVQQGDRFIRDGWGMKAAEAYRQAWRQDPRDGTLRKLAVALLDGGDYPLASWALVRSVGSNEKGILDYTVALDDSLGGARITRAVTALEKYLVDNPNDEGSNFLLGALYVVTGREYAGYVVLTRLRAADYEIGTVDLFIKQARLALGK